MDEFLTILTTYPGFLPSLLVGVLLIFWLLAILGALDFEHFGPDWLGGHHHGAELPEADHGHGTPDVLMALGFDRLPFSVVISAIVFIWWLLTMLAMQYLAPWIPLPAWIESTALLLGCLLLALPVAGMLVRPLKPLFVVHRGPAQQSVIGRPCRILTLKVERDFGQAEVQVDNGAPLHVRVCALGDSPLKKGDRALIIDVDPETERFIVEPYA